ncbi:hypothetical protein Kpol_1032p71 [Vanderwaltozyma polyspora DSM 70294]|uniref:Protein YIM1 n=1 Tax=Vanderwaltozyma polyspora (strain ATCC 22028 / DSM 70294 / BCRC 21397 / CBS 2163 / NBRC 10782 / NRRL Y-8283 / UCD 57-17) TaxID=436907 RepID=YIM1_VANPO|nr:uncharacterized protein Kpol_1032p71 [Vanderwaltozyma polyspora DSM 70294]A7TH23.1 RecName: Full=Protein YIM1 [Vanderwaltozyma polyspora DSM 70294]EDO18475.1 hypothetical protein Kpol_1032p71 [Vanderwaltozyma polyspora DSM 70294]
MVAHNSVTYINRTTPLTITSEEIDLDRCYKDSEIVVEVHAAALNPIDILLHALSYPSISGRKKKVLGKDYSGVVVKAGKSVKGFKVGDLVNGMYEDFLYRARGSVSNYLILDPSKQLSIAHFKKLEGQTDDDAFIQNAGWPLIFGTAHTLLTEKKQNLGPDSKVLVLGASTSVGNALLKIAKNELKIGTVVGTCSEGSIQYNKETVGFDHLVPYNDTSKSAAQHIRDYVKNELHGEKFDLIADCCGSNEFFPFINEIMKSKTKNGHYLTIVGDNKFNYRKIELLKAINICGLIRRFNPFKNYNYSFTMVPSASDYMELGAKMIQKGTYKPQIDSVYDFEQYQDAVERLLSNRAKGKIVIKVK